MHPADPVDLEQARKVAVTAAEAAGVLLHDGATDSTADLGIRTKDATGDVVTDLDLAAERLIVARLQAAFPGHRVVAEESGLVAAADHTADADSSWVWLVDPLDGTNNVAIGLTAYVVGIALCCARRPVLGVVHDPVAGQTWSAIRGRGARGPEDIALRPPGHPPPDGLVVAWTQGYRVDRRDTTARALRLVLESGSRRLLQLWAPLLSWVMLARGDIDGFVGYRAEAVDLPAGSLIAGEAGIVVCGLDGTPFDERIDLAADDRSFVAGHPRVIPKLLAMVRAAGGVTVGGLSGQPD